MSPNITKFRRIGSSIVLCLVTSVASLPVLAAAKGKLTGQLTLSPASPTVGQSAKLKIGYTGSPCTVSLNWGDATSAEVKDTVQDISKVYNKAGTYTITATGSGYGDYCSGQSTLTVTVKVPPLKLPAMTPTACAPGFANQTASPQDGELKCKKIVVGTCPTSWDYVSTSGSTGKVVCKPKAVQCPEGWVGGIVENGNLVCNPGPLPKVQCAESTPTNQWGASYFTDDDGWSTYGCAKNLPAPK